MKSRCTNPNVDCYPNYGGRGVEVCQEWMYYTNFAAWAKANGYSENLTLERVDVNGNYCPENCTWASYKDQANNTRFNRFYTIDGESKTISQWADEYGIDYQSLIYRLDEAGMDIEEALTTPLRKHHQKYKIGDIEDTVSGWASRMGIDPEVIWRRLFCGWDYHRAIMEPIKPQIHMITMNGEEHSIAEWSDILGIDPRVVSSRLLRGWDEIKALTTPVRNAKTYTYDGKTMTIQEWADYLGMDHSAIRYRLSHGWSIDETFGLPKAPGRRNRRGNEQ